MIKSYSFSKIGYFTIFLLLIASNFVESLFNKENAEYVDNEESHDDPNDNDYLAKNIDYYVPPSYPAPLTGRLQLTPEWADAIAKARDIVSVLSITEKVNLTTGIGYGSGVCQANLGTIEKLDISSICFQNGAHGVSNTDFATNFPSTLAAGSTFNKDLIYQLGRAVARESKTKGIDVLMGPGLNLGYHAAGGHNTENFGSDPYLVGKLASAFIKASNYEGVLSCPTGLIGYEQEHFKHSNEWENGKYKHLKQPLDVQITDKVMHEIYLWPFADAVRANAGCFACSYNKVNGTYACENSYLINHLLKEELGFQGFVTSEIGAMRSGVNSILSGADVNIPGDIFGDYASGKSSWGPLLTRAIYNETIPQYRLNDMVTRLLSAFIVNNVKIPLSNDPEEMPNFSSWSQFTYDKEYPFQSYGSIKQVNKHVDAREKFTEKVALQTAREAIVLLKHTKSALPISVDDGYNRMLIAGIGSVTSPQGVDVEDAVTGDGAIYQSWGPNSVSAFNAISPADVIYKKAIERDMLVDIVTNEYDIDNIEKSAELANVAIVFAFANSGDSSSEIDGNYGDRKNYTLWANNVEMIKSIADRCAKTIVVINSPGPVDLEEFIDHKNIVGVLWSAPLGQYYAQAIGDIIFGDYQPSGNLPFTISKHTDNYVDVIDRVPLNGKPVDDLNRLLDYRYFDEMNIVPRYPFGHGLTYTKFKLSDLTISEKKQPSIDLSKPDPYLDPYFFDHTSVEDPSEALFPFSEFKPVPGHIYPYLYNTKVYSLPFYNYPTGYKPDVDCDFENDPTCDAPPKAGGALGGNPDLFEVLYKIKASVENTGGYEGYYTAQLYVEFPRGRHAPTTHVRQLRGIDKVFVKKGYTKKIKFELTTRDLSYWDVEDQTWVIYPGIYKIYIGSSSRKFDLLGEIDISASQNQ